MSFWVSATKRNGCIPAVLLLHSIYSPYSALAFRSLFSSFIHFPSLLISSPFIFLFHPPTNSINFISPYYIPTLHINIIILFFSKSFPKYQFPPPLLLTLNNTQHSNDMICYDVLHVLIFLMVLIDLITHQPPLTKIYFKKNIDISNTSVACFY